MQRGRNELQPFADVFPDTLPFTAAMRTLPLGLVQVENHAASPQGCGQRFAAVAVAWLGFLVGGISCRTRRRRLWPGRCRPGLAGGDDLGGEQEQLVFVDALAFLSVALQQLLQLVL